MTDQPAEIWFERRVSPAALLALLILAGVSCWLGWNAYRGELRQIFSATPSIEIDLAPKLPPAAVDSTPSIVIDLTTAPAKLAVAAIPPATPIAPATAPAATVAPANAPEPATAAAAPVDNGSATAAVTTPAPEANAPANQTQALASISPPAVGTGSVDSPTPIAPGSTAPAPAAPAPAAPAPAASAPVAAPPVAAAPVASQPQTTPTPTLSLTPAPASSGGTAPGSSAPGSTAPGSTTSTAAGSTSTPPATPSAATTADSSVGAPPPAPAAAASAIAPAPTTPSDTVLPEASSADLLSAIGKAPAPVTQAMAVASATPPATAAGATTTGSITAGGTQSASVIDTFLPQTGDSALPAWQRNARPFDVNDPRPRIAIVITKLGLLHGTTLAAIDQLPADVTLSFSPYASDLGQWIGHARSLGHEVMLDLPMESSQSGTDPGPDGLLTSISTEENLQRLAWVIGRADGFVGLAGLLGDRFTASPVGLRPVLRDMARRGLMFLDPHANADSVASSEATKLHLPRAIADLTIDDRPDRVSIDIQLAELERRARVTGFAVGIANGYPVTIERLADWARSLAERNLALAPVSAIADQQADR